MADTATCYTLRVFATVPNIDGKPEYTAEEVCEYIEAAMRRVPIGGYDVEVLETEIIEE
jgi:hypothetical protein